MSYKVVRYGRWMYTILNTTTGIIMRKPGKEDSPFAYDEGGTTFMTFRTADEAQNYIDKNL